MKEWQEVTGKSPCPACGKPDWCAWTAERWLKCERSDEAPQGMVMVSSKDGSTLFRPEGDAAPKPTTAPRKPAQARTFKTHDDAIATLERQHGHTTARWEYHNASGDLVGLVLRWDTQGGKDIRPVSLTDDGMAWCIGAMPGPRPVYRLPELQAADPEDWVWVFEGEKCADVAKAIGLVATTSVGGAKAAAKTDWSAMLGKVVVVVPDNDDPGSRYADDVAKLANEAGAASVLIVRLVDKWPDLPKGGDLADLAERDIDGCDLWESLRQMASEADPYSFPPLDSGLNETNLDHANHGSGRVSFVRLGDLPEPPPTQWIWPGIIPAGAACLFSAAPKCGKSTLLGCLIRDLAEGGPLIEHPTDAPVMILSEEPQAVWYERQRTLGLPPSLLLVERPSHTNANAPEWLELIDSMRDEINRQGCCLVILDTLGATWPTEDENDATRVQRALNPLRALSNTGAAMMCVHHTRKSGGSHGQAHRGSSALAGWFDVLADMRPENNAGETDPRRILAVRGRFAGLRNESVLEYVDGAYSIIGDRVDMRNASFDKIIEPMLPTESPGKSADELLDVWPGGRAPGKPKLLEALKRGAEQQRWWQTGKGKKRDPLRFYRRSQVA